MRIDSMTTTTQHREGEIGNLPARCERCFMSGNYWYYSTREKINIGPFDSRNEAVNGVNAFVKFVCESPDIVDTLKKYRSAA